MAKVNLTDMLWNRAEAPANAKGAAKPQARAPIASAQAHTPADIPGMAGPSQSGRKNAAGNTSVPFRDRVEESHAKLGKTGHRFFQKPAADGAANHHPAAARPAPSRDAQAAGRTSPRTDFDRAAGDSSRPGRATDGASARPTRSEKKSIADSALEAQASAAFEAVPVDTSIAPASAPSRFDPAEADADAAAGKDDLENGLKQMGIEVSEEQLSDPAFLSQMLALVQSFLSGDEIQPEAGSAPMNENDSVPATAVQPSAADAGEAVEDQPAVIAALPAAVTPEAVDSSPMTIAQDVVARGASDNLPDEITASPEADAAQDAEAVPASDATGAKRPTFKELEALISDRLNALTGAREPVRKGEEAMAWRPVAPMAPGGLSIEPGPSRNSDPMRPFPGFDAGAAPMLDQDRVRVLQAAGLSGENKGGQPLASDFDSAGPMPKDGDGDAKAANEDPLSAALPALTTDSHDADGGAQADLSGRGAPQGQAAAAGRDAQASHREAGAVFHTSLEQIRAADGRSLEAKPAMPHAAVPEQSVLSQISRKLAALNGREAGVVSIQLEPEHLGRVRVALEMKDGSMSARIGVENDDIRKIVDANLGNLRGTLEDQGIKLLGLEVSVEQRHGSLFNPDGSNAQEFFHRRGGDAAAAPAQGAEADSAESDTGRRLGYNTMEYIA